MKIYIFLLVTITFVQASPKRPFRAEEIPEAPEEKDNEQEIAFGAFSYYDDEEPEEPQPEEAVESRKRPNFPIFSEGSTFGSSAGNRPTGPPAFVINSQNQDNDEEETETLPYDVIERGYVSACFIYITNEKGSEQRFLFSNMRSDPTQPPNGYARKKLKIWMRMCTRIGG